ncbi:hypothetical protein ROZALSC1DRAFT_26229, partial [Rozella allomycis CSF55]
YNFAIRCASEFGLADVVKRLLEDPRVDPSADGNDAIRKASVYGHAEVVKILIHDSRVESNIIHLGIYSIIDDISITDLSKLWKNDATDRNIAVLNSQFVKGSGDWLNVVPVSGLGLTMDSRSYRVLLWRRLGLKFFNHHGSCLECAK